MRVDAGIHYCGRTLAHWVSPCTLYSLHRQLHYWRQRCLKARMGRGGLGRQGARMALLFVECLPGKTSFCPRLPQGLGQCRFLGVSIECVQRQMFGDPHGRSLAEDDAPRLSSLLRLLLHQLVALRRGASDIHLGDLQHRTVGAVLNLQIP